LAVGVTDRLWTVADLAALAESAEPKPGKPGPYRRHEAAVSIGSFVPRARAAQTGLAFWICAFVTAMSALVSAGFSVAALFGPSHGDIFARYAASRSIALLMAVLCCIGFRSRGAIAALAFVMVLVQGFDGVIGVLADDPAKTYGPFVLALVNLAALVWLLRSHDERHAGTNSNGRATR
jgi:hypothetical protein